MTTPPEPAPEHDEMASSFCAESEFADLQPVIEGSINLSDLDD